jgi:hypothetical protein
MGRENYLIDTNIAIYYFGEVLSKESELFIEAIFNEKYYISVINRIELLGFKDLNGPESKALTSFVDNSVIFDLDEDIILETIRIRREYSIKLPDAIIAATCLINDCQLITNNIKDFGKIDGLQIINISPSIN